MSCSGTWAPHSQNPQSGEHQRGGTDLYSTFKTTEKYFFLVFEAVEGVQYVLGQGLEVDYFTMCGWIVHLQKVAWHLHVKIKNVFTCIFCFVFQLNKLINNKRFILKKVSENILREQKIFLNIKYLNYYLCLRGMFTRQYQLKF